MRKSKLQVHGVLHPINLKFVTSRTLCKLGGAKPDEYLEGLYDPGNETVYVLSTLKEPSRVHIFLHEIYHMFHAQTSRMEEEGKADSFAALCMRMFDIHTMEDIVLCKKE
jgi:hypothetical protein